MSRDTLATYWEKLTPQEIDFLYCSIAPHRDPGFHKGLLPFVSAAEAYRRVSHYLAADSVEEMFYAQRLCQILVNHRPLIIDTPYDPMKVRELAIRAKLATIRNNSKK